MNMRASFFKAALLLLALTPRCNGQTAIQLANGCEEKMISGTSHLSSASSIETNSFLEQLFKGQPKWKSESLGSSEGSFTGPGKRQLLISGFLWDPRYSGSGAQIPGRYGFGIFENGDLVFRVVREGFPMRLIGVGDLLGKGVTSFWTLDYYEGMGFGFTNLRVRTAEGQKIRTAFQHELHSYSFHQAEEKCFKISYLCGPITTPSSYKVELTRSRFNAEPPPRKP